MKKIILAVLITACVLTGCAGTPEPAPVIIPAPAPSEPAPVIARESEPVAPPPAEPAPVTAVARTPETAPAPTPVVTAPPMPITPAREIVMRGAGNYRVVRGDSLSHVAAKLYGRENMYYFPLIRLANMTITNPDVLRAGVYIIIPDLQANLNNEEARSLLKAEMLSTAAHYDRLNQFKASAELRNFANRL